MEITHKITMELTQAGQSRPRIDAVQGDSFTRIVELSLFENGVAWSVPEGASVMLRYSKSDNTGGSYDTLPDGTKAWQAQENVLQIVLAPQVLTAAGFVEAQAELVREDSVLGTFLFRIFVEEDPSLGTVESEDYVNWLGWMESELDDRLTQARDSGEFLPEIRIGQVRTLPAGSAASATITGDKAAPVLNLNIPDGTLMAYESADYPGCYYRIVNGYIEWINPPERVNQEYRTTRRCLGKAVYTRIFDVEIDNAASGGSVPTQIACQHLLQVTSWTDGGLLLPYGQEDSEYYREANAHIGPAGTLRYGVIFGSAVAGETWYVQVWYTKDEPEQAITVEKNGDTLMINTVLAVSTQDDAIIIGGV